MINIIKTIYADKKVRLNPSCYIYDMDIIKKNIAQIQKYASPNISLYYAMKANPNATILNLMKKTPFIKGVEIASGGELKKAKRYFKSKNILFTGPGKTPEELRLSIKNKIRFINVESIIEAIRIEQITCEMNVPKVPCLLRINIDYAIEGAQEYMAGYSTKMGIDQQRFEETFNFIKRLEHLDIQGIHIFSASGILDYKSLIKYAKHIFSYVQDLEKRLDFKVNVIDFGGGIGIDYTNKNKTFDIKSYFSALKKLIYLYHFDDKEIIMELGKYLVGNAGFYTSKIIDIKDIKNYKHIVVAGGVNHFRLPIATDRKHPVFIVPMHEKPLYQNQPFVRNEKVDIEGPLCMNEDKLSWQEYINEAHIGDIVVFRQSGAYCYTASTLEFLGHDYPFEICIKGGHR